MNGGSELDELLIEIRMIEEIMEDLDQMPPNPSVEAIKRSLQRKLIGKQIDLGALSLEMEREE